MEKACFTVDVEDGISLSLRDYYGVNVPTHDRVVDNVKIILDLLDKNEAKATFFILGNVAEAFPQLVKDVANQGHEIGVHGYNHYKFTQMSPEQAFEEVSTARKLMQDLSGQEVYGHRAPEFSINDTNLWAFDVLVHAGFTYDSSIIPSVIKSRGMKNISPLPHVIKTSSGEIVEFPITLGSILNKTIPACGGRFFQILPYSINRRLFSSVLENQNAVFYMHPYEIDMKPYPDFYQKAFKKASLKKKISRHIRWFGKSGNYKKIDNLLQEFEFVTMYDALKTKEVC